MKEAVSQTHRCERRGFWGDEGKPEVRLRLYECGKVEARLDFPGIPLAVELSDLNGETLSDGYV